jgi:hypothetical protein
MRTVADVRAALENYDDDDEFHIVLSEPPVGYVYEGGDVLNGVRIQADVLAGPSLLVEPLE